MEEALLLPVTYRGEEMEFPFKVASFGFTTRYLIDVGGIEVTFERDDSGDFRAIISKAEELGERLPERELIAAICGVLTKLLDS